MQKTGFGHINYSHLAPGYIMVTYKGKFARIEVDST
jgi:hypothetical protein